MVGKDGGANAPLMRDTSFINKHGEEVKQFSQTADGVQKGIKSYLEERKLFNSEINIFCTGEDKKTCGNKFDDSGSKIPCCNKNILANQPDFVRQESWPWLKEFLAKRGHMCTWLPAYHCEFNPCEMIFSRLKFECRKQCNYKFDHMLEVLLKTLDNFDVHSIRKFYAHCIKYMSLYQHGLTGVLLMYAVKEATSHRRIREVCIYYYETHFQYYSKKYFYKL